MDVWKGGEYWTISDAAILEYLNPEKRWKGLRGIGMVRAQRRIDQEITRETRYFLPSFSSVKTFASAVRSHWELKTVFIGSLISRFVKTNHACDKDTLTKIWPCYVTLALNWCARNTRPT
jgi:hypothetical protein